MSNIIVAITVILTLFLILHLYYQSFKKKNIEKFGVYETPQSQGEQNASYKISKCAVLEPTNPDQLSAKAYEKMRNMINGNRIKEWKPRDTSLLGTDSNMTYCYLYNDTINDMQDNALMDGTCDLNNPMFQNEMIRAAFSNNLPDNVHTYPVNKCVIQIDNNKVTDANLDTFYGYQANNKCNERTASMRVSRKNAQEQELVEKAKLRVLQEDNTNIVNAYNYVSPLLESCNERRDHWKSSYIAKRSDYNSNVNTFNTLQNNYQACTQTYDDKSTRYERDTLSLTGERDINKVNYETQCNINIDCQARYQIALKDRNIAQNEESQAAGNNGTCITDTAQLQKLFKTCLSNVDHQKEQYNTFDNLYTKCYPNIELNSNCQVQLKNCTETYNVCDSDRKTRFNMWSQEKIDAAKCETDFLFNQNLLNMCNNSNLKLNVQIDQNRIDIENNKHRIVKLQNDTITCNTNVSSKRSAVSVIEQQNTSLYNELQALKKNCKSTTSAAIQSQIDTMTKAGKSQISTAEKTAAASCETTNICTTGLVDCGVGYVYANIDKCVNPNKCAIQTNNERICAESCIRDKACKSIYFDKKKGNCYKLKSRVETAPDREFSADIWRDSDPNGGYSGNKNDEQIAPCPGGSIACIYGVGQVSAAASIIPSKLKMETYDKCARECRKEANCGAIHYSAANTCHMYNNSFGSMAGGGDPWRDNYMSDGISAEMDGKYVDECEMGEWTPWSWCSAPCGPGTQTRTREVIWQSPKLTCPHTVESKPCDLGCCMGPMEWGGCSARFNFESGTSIGSTPVTVRGTGPCNPPRSSRPCDAPRPPFDLILHEHNDYNGHKAEYSPTRGTRRSGNDFWIDGTPFGTSSYKIWGNGYYVIFYNGNRQTHKSQKVGFNGENWFWIPRMYDVDVTRYKIEWGG